MSELRPLIWIVDDSRTEAAITQAALGSSYDYEWFEDGSLVVERLVGDGPQPDVLLLDWVMPGMAGDEVCRFLRSRPRTQELPIIMVTASRIETQDVVQGLTSGANDYVARPFAAEELRARVHAALRTKSLKDAANRERQRLRTVNQVGHALLRTHTSVEQIIEQLASALTVSICDGCSVLILPGPFPAASTSHHRHDPTGQALAAIASVADPVIHHFPSSDAARSGLPPAYGSYIDRFGLRSLAILPFPMREPIRGIVTVTRDGGAQPFDDDDLATIETCIDYAGLAVESAVQLDAERVGRAQLDTVLGNLPVGILATDADGKVTLVNAAARGLVPNIAAATTLREVFELAKWTAGDGTPLGDADWILRDTLRSRLAVSSELQLHIPDENKPRAVSVSAVPLRDGQDAIVGSVTVFQDVSAERAISVERERVSRFQQEMLGIVGHDLRNPLSAVVAGAELLSMQVEDTAARETIRRVQSSTGRMSRIVDQLLDVTRAQLGQGIPIFRREVSLLVLVQTVISELTLANPQARLELDRADEVTGFWDPDRLEQVVSNLASNALHYGKAGSPVVIDVVRAGDLATIAVRNHSNGAAIPDQQIASLFVPFRRASKAHEGGLGLGLYIVQEIVRAHGGTIDVTSTDAETVFRVQLQIESKRPARSADVQT